MSFRKVISLAKLNISLFTFSDGNIRLWFWSGFREIHGQEDMLFSSAPAADSYECLSVQHPPWLTPLYSIVLPLILKDQVEEL